MSSFSQTQNCYPIKMILQNIEYYQYYRAVYYNSNIKMLSESFYKSNLSFITQTSLVKAKGSFQLVKKTVTQKQIILQIIYLILGMHGSIFCKKTGSDQIQLSGKYQLSHLTSQTLRNAVEQSIKICNQTKYVQKQTRKLFQTSKNAVVKTFCQSIFEYLQSVKKYFSFILSEINCINEPVHGKITLLNMQNIISQRNHMLGFIIRCLNSCFIQYESKPQVVRLLDKIWQIQQQLLSYSQFNKQQLIKIFKRSVSHYFENVKDWLLMRSIPSSMDFFINMPQTKNMNNTKRQLSEYFLHKNQQLQLSKLPKIIQNQSYGILEIGKTIRFINLYYQDYERQKLFLYLKIQDQFKILDEALKVEPVVTFPRIKVEKLSLNDRIKNKNKQKAVIRQKTNIQQNPYEMFTKVSHTFNINWIQKVQIKKVKQQQKQVQDKNMHGFLFYVKCLLIQILQNINKKCLRFFRDPNDTIMITQKNRIQTSLTNRLIGIKKFMLLEQGDFLSEFFNFAESIIDKQKGQVSHNKIYSCIDQAIQNSSAKNLPKQILNNLHFDFIKQNDKRVQKFKLWVLFCFDYRQESPINYIFHAQMMQKLKDICNLIFKLKKGQVVLRKLWSFDRQLIRTDKNRLKIINKAKILRNSLNAFLNNCLSYVVNKIDVLWTQYIAKITKAPTVFEIIQQSVQIISNLQKNSTNNNLFYNGTIMALSLIQKFRKLHQMIKDPNLIIPVKQIDELEFQLRSIAEIVMKIPELNEIINYNQFFSKYD